MHGHLIRLKPFLGIAILIFLSAVFFSLWVIPNLSGTDRDTLQQLLLATGSDLEGWRLFLFIFGQNTVKIFIAMISGAILAIGPVLFTFVNGFAIGAFGVLFGELGQVRFFMAGITPHGIFEIPALLIGSAAGIKFGVQVVRKILKRSGEKISGHFAEAFKIFFQVVLPLLLIAAVIETYFTPVLLEIALR